MNVRRQRGAALILMATVLVLGVAWFAIGAGASRTVTDYQREAKTGAALRDAKTAVLAYAAQYAARSTTTEPGQMPCPESVNYYAAGTEGQASTSCSNATESIGRLPWRTLGIDQIRDGYGEPLWLVLSRGFRSAPINFGTPGQINYNGGANAAVALIIAPGRAVNTSSDPGTPPAACAKVNQASTNRYSTSSPLDPTKFLECGNATGAYGNPGNMTSWSSWSNDRVIAITAQEWADAIAPAVADRIQRQLAPALEDWRSVQAPANWPGNTFLPYASTFSDPASNGFCGTYGQLEGLLPVTLSAAGTCAPWSSGNVSNLLSSLFLGGSCTPGAAAMTCTYSGWANGLGLFNVRITATAPNVASSFRAPTTAASITTSSGTVSNFSLALSASTGQASLRFDVSQSLGAFNFGVVTVTIPNLPDAAVLTDTRMTWFLNNNWHRYTYYALSNAATVNPGTDTCPSAGGAQCLSLTGTQDKRMVLALVGPRAVGTQTQPSNFASDYLESRISATQYIASTVSSTFNDRLAGCPSKLSLQSGGSATLCN